MRVQFFFRCMLICLQYFMESDWFEKTNEIFQRIAFSHPLFLETDILRYEVTCIPKSSIHEDT